MTLDGLPPTFTPFPRLPTELKIRIWRAFHDLKEKIQSRLKISRRYLSLSSVYLLAS